MTRRAGPGVSALDQLSRQLLANADRLEVRLACRGAEKQAIYRLRHQQVVERGWISAAALPDGLERDRYDASGLHVGAWRNASLVGAMRLVLPSNQAALPVEEAFGIRIEPRGQVVEAGRLVIAPRYRGDPAHTAWGALFARAWLTMRGRGFSLLCGAASTVMIERLRALGLPFQVVGPAREYWGVERVPVRLDPAHGRPQWYTA